MKEIFVCNFLLMFWLFLVPFWVLNFTFLNFSFVSIFNWVPFLFIQAQVSIAKVKRDYLKINIYPLWKKSFHYFMVMTVIFLTKIIRLILIFFTVKFGTFQFPPKISFWLRFTFLSAYCSVPHQIILLDATFLTAVL